MEKSERATFQFKGFQIVESHIVRKEGQEISEKINIGFNPRAQIKRSENTFRILLGVEVKDEAGAFKANIEAIGFYKFADTIDRDTLNNLFYVNAPAILFPYIRAYVSTLTNLSGLETITLPTINMSSIGGALEKQTAEI